jgi:peptidoglycan/LPS O-acetylase OafA/YrhL
MNQPAALSQWSPAAATAAEQPVRVVARNDAIDFTKGVLVLAMVVYHWFNYFVSVEGDFYRYLRFLTPSFILIAGFLVTVVYLPRLRAGDDSVHRRLFGRGVRILLLFTALNLGASALISRNYNGARLGAGLFFSEAFDIYVKGRGPAVFEVLVPIAYFLMVAPPLLWATVRSRYAMPAAALGAMALAVYMNASGTANANVELLSFGVLGMAHGLIPLDALDRVARRPAAIAALYVAYLAAVSFWNVRLPVQIAGVLVSLLAIYAIALRFGSSGVVASVCVELGRYSLFAYVVQVGFLQVLRLAAGDTLRGAATILPFAATLGLTIVSVRVVDVGRRHSKRFDQMFRWVFA